MLCMAEAGVSGAFISAMAADANDAESDMRFAILRVSRLLRHCTSAAKDLRNASSHPKCADASRADCDALNCLTHAGPHSVQF
jgi:hypothetical protein